MQTPDETANDYDYDDATPADPETILPDYPTSEPQDD